MSRVVVVCPPFVEVVGDVVSPWVGRGVLKVNDDVLDIQVSYSRQKKVS